MLGSRTRWIVLLGLVTLAVAGCSDSHHHGTGTRASGAVWGWGSDDDQRLGPNQQVDAYVPVRVGTLDHVVAVAASPAGRTDYALRDDGTVWAWGLDATGSSSMSCRCLGTPTQIQGLTDVQAIAAGDHTGYALRGDGTVWAWGAGGSGQLGNGGTADHATPIQVSDLRDVVAIGAGPDTGYAVRRDGSAWAWGSGAYGVLGRPDVTTSPTPVQVPGLPHVRAVAGADTLAYALADDGTVWAWGVQGTSGRLGTGRATDTPTQPGQVMGDADLHPLTHVIAIAAGRYDGFALRDDGTVWGWGADDGGVSLGDGGTAAGYTCGCLPWAAAVGGLDHVRAIAAAESGFALRDDGTVWAWGAGTRGQLGNNQGADSATPVQVSGLAHVLAVAPGLAVVAG